MQATIKKVTRDRMVTTGEEFLDVTVEFFEEVENPNGGMENKILDVRKLGFPLGTTAEQIKEEVQKAVATFEQERAQAEEQKEVDAKAEQVNEVIENLEGLTI